MTELRELLGRLSDAFGPSGNEKVVRALVREEIQASVDRIDVDAMGNLIAFKAGDGPEPRLRVMLSAHMDTVGKDRGIKPQIRDGVIYSDGTTILGGDDKSGVAAILEVIQSLREDNVAHPPLEAVISVSEEVQLLGARSLDKSKLRARRI